MMFLRKTQKIETANGVSELVKVNLGGYEQWLLIRGECVNNPIILFLHGGPGTANIGIAAATQKQLEKNFIVVNWDQLGAGLSYSKSIPKEAMTIEKMIEYTKELIQYLLSRFEKKKVYLIGHSWGSLLGILTAQKYPQYIEKYAGVSQVVGGKETEKLCYEYCLTKAKSSNDRKALSQLRKINEPPYDDWMKGLQVRSALTSKFGGAVKNGSLSSLYLKTMLKSKEYNLNDIYRFMAGFSLSLKYLWPEVMTMNLLDEVNSLSMPVYFFLGKHDYSAPSSLAEAYFSKLKADHKEIIWFKNSAHMCNLEEQTKFISHLESIFV
ncbi:MAG: acetyltransferase [Clostridia bacterium]|nr:acetyltransferase [Clostridia bacterium]